MKWDISVLQIHLTYYSSASGHKFERRPLRLQIYINKYYYYIHKEKKCFKGNIHQNLVLRALRVIFFL